jgi:hypothetical protein
MTSRCKPVQHTPTKIYATKEGMFALSILKSDHAKAWPTSASISSPSTPGRSHSRRPIHPRRGSPRTGRKAADAGRASRRKQQPLAEAQYLQCHRVEVCVWRLEVIIFTSTSIRAAHSSRAPGAPETPHSFSPGGVIGKKLEATTENNTARKPRLAHSLRPAAGYGCTLIPDTLRPRCWISSPLSIAQPGAPVAIAPVTGWSKRPAILLLAEKTMMAQSIANTQAPGRAQFTPTLLLLLSLHARSPPGSHRQLLRPSYTTRLEKTRASSLPNQRECGLQTNRARQTHACPCAGLQSFRTEHILF